MTRDEAIKYLRINRERMTAQMRMALEALVPEFREPEMSLVAPPWIPCTRGQHFDEECLVQYPAYCEISWTAREDGWRVPIQVLCDQLPKLPADLAKEVDKMVEEIMRKQDETNR